MMDSSASNWWHNEVIYQIYPRSFQDSNGDGIGDIPGIISRLDYLKELGITMIWLSPVYKSPMVDMGYDISDYQEIDPQFGTMDDFDELLSELKKREIKIIMDLVVNHTSDQHKWFIEALQNPDSKYRDYYIFKKTKDGNAPNNWRSIFGGSTWEKVPNETNTFYFHTFAKQQPELNWENKELREEIYSMINWWLEKGVDGYRVDAITHLKKDLDWESLPADDSDGLVDVIKKGQNRPGIEVFLTELKEKTFEPNNAFTIGEAYGVPDNNLGSYIGKDGYFSTVFDFSYMNIEVKDVNHWYLGRSNWTIPDLKKIIFHSHVQADQVGAFLANVIENHDQPRALSKYIINEENQTPTAAKALAVMYFLLRGIPLVYQGQEIGMKNFERKSIDDFNDISSIDNYKVARENKIDIESALKSVNAKSRDNARVPMQWDSTKNVGFTNGTPWLKVGDFVESINVSDERNDNSSVLNFYKKLIQLRQNSEFSNILINGEQIEVDSPNNVISYDRIIGNTVVKVRVNLGDKVEQVSGEIKKLLINNKDESPIVQNNLIQLEPFQAIVFQ